MKLSLGFFMKKFVKKAEEPSPFVRLPEDASAVIDDLLYINSGRTETGARPAERAAEDAVI